MLYPLVIYAIIFFICSLLLVLVTFTPEEMLDVSKEKREKFFGQMLAFMSMDLIAMIITLIIGGL